MSKQTTVDAKALIAILENAVTDWDGSQEVDGAPLVKDLNCGNARAIIAALTALSEQPAPDPAGLTTVAFMWTLFMGGGQFERRLTFTKDNPWGKPGTDYDAEYLAVPVPLAAAEAIAALSRAPEPVAARDSTLEEAARIADDCSILDARTTSIAATIRAAKGGNAHPDDLAVDCFAAAMKAKLARKRTEGRGGWEDPAQCSTEFLSKLLREHVEKGDPLDVGNLAMMLHQRGEAIAALSRVPEAVAGAEPRGCPTPGACSCPAPSSQWQPIRTAKRDGSEIIARKDGYAAFSCFWDGSQWVHYDHDDGYIAYDPDEWMPLPASEHALALVAHAAADRLAAKEAECEALRVEVERWAEQANKEDECRQMWQARATAADAALKRIRAETIERWSPQEQARFVVAYMERETRLPLGDMIGMHDAERIRALASEDSAE